MKRFTFPWVRVGPAVVACAMLLAPVSCTNRFFVSVVQSAGEKQIAHDKLRVSIDLSPSSLMMSRITIVNKRADTVSVMQPFKIILRFSGTHITLPAVGDYRDYVRMRYAEAKKKCSDARYPYNCSDAIDNAFKRQLEAKPFAFGPIPPGKRREGYIAFNLPDPLNPTEQAESIAEALMPDTETLRDGMIEVNIAARSPKAKSEYKFTFPVKIVTSNDENNVLLGVLKNY